MCYLEKNGNVYHDLAVDDELTIRRDYPLEVKRDWDSERGNAWYRSKMKGLPYKELAECAWDGMVEKNNSRDRIGRPYPSFKGLGDSFRLNWELTVLADLSHSDFRLGEETEETSFRPGWMTTRYLWKYQPKF